MVLITSEEYKELLEIKFKYELANKPTMASAKEEPVSEDEIEVIEVDTNFKLGDKVRIISNREGNLGETGVIRRIDNDCLPYLVDYANGDFDYWANDEIELVEEREEN